MHEAGAVMAAIGQIVQQWPPTRKTGSLRLEIRDATRANAEAVSFYATAVLEDLDLGDVAFSVHTCAVTCDSCGEAAVPTISHPMCESCGAPMRSRPGLAIVCRDETEPGPSAMDRLSVGEGAAS